MSDRILDVNAYTTLDYARGYADGGIWTEEAAGVLDVDPSAGVVELAVELDPASLHRVDAHADVLELTPVQARTVASALADAAAVADEQATEADGDGADDDSADDDDRGGRPDDSGRDGTENDNA